MWISKNNVEQCATCLDYQHLQPYEKAIVYDLPCKPQLVVGSDIFSINNMLLYIVDYCSKFPIVKKADSLSADNLITAAKFVFTEFGLP